MYGLLLWIGLLDNLFYGRSHISRPGELSIRFVLDEKLRLHRPPRPASAWDTRGGWYQPYATSHDDLDKDKALFAEVKNAALAFANMVKLIRTGKYHAPVEKLHDPREK